MRLRHQVVLLFLVGFLTYLPSFGNQFVWDDEQFIYKNSYVLDGDIAKIFTTNTIAGAGQHSDYYRPLTTFSFAIDYAIWGLRPFGFHFTNTLLHTFAGILLFLLLRKLKFTGALVVALFFLTHPIQTESVVYINSRGDSLYTFWAMLGLYALAKSFDKNHHYQLRSIELQLNKVTLLAISVLCYILSILSKEIGIMVIGLYGLVWAHMSFPQRRINWQYAWFLATSMLSAGVYVVFRATWLNFGNTFNLYAAENIYTSSIMVRLYTFTHVLWTYFRLLLIPYPLHMERSAQVITSLLSQGNVATLAIGVFLFILGWREWKQKHSWWIWFGSIWFAISITPVSGIIPINGLIYEHWLYVPMIGYFIVILQFFRNLPKRVALPIIIALSCIYIALTIRQNWLWRSPISLYEYLLRFTETGRIHNNLAMAYDDTKHYELAVKHYQRAIELEDYYPQTHHNLGQTYLNLGQSEAAEREWLQAIEMSPSFHFSYPPLINLYLQQQQYDKALPYIQTLRKAYPDNPEFRQIESFIRSIE